MDWKSFAKEHEVVKGFIHNVLFSWISLGVPALLLFGYGVFKVANPTSEAEEKVEQSQPQAEAGRPDAMPKLVSPEVPRSVAKPMVFCDTHSNYSKARDFIRLSDSQFQCVHCGAVGGFYQDGSDGSESFIYRKDQTPRRLPDFSPGAK